MYRILFLLLFPVSTLFAQTSYDQSKISAATLKAVENLGAYSTFYSSQISPGGGTTGAWDDFSILKNSASLAELKELCRHPKPVVRCYAFLAVAYRDSGSVLPLLIEHLTDTEPISTRIGCFNGGQAAGSLMYSLVVNDGMQWGNYKLSDKEIEQLDSVVLHHPGKIIPVKEAALARVSNQKAHYDIIRADALKGDKEAIIALASYHNLDDTTLILSLLPAPDCSRLDRTPDDYFTGSGCMAYDFLKAVRRWPAPFFLPKLKRFMRGHYWEQGSMIPLLWSALAAYRTPETVELLCDEVDYFARHPSPVFRMYDVQFIIDQYDNDPVARPLRLLYSKYSNAELPLDNLHRLMQNRPELAWELTRYYLDPVRCKTTYYYFWYDSCKSLAPRLLDIGLKINHDQAAAFINRTLQYQQHYIGSAFCTKIGTLKNDTAFNAGIISFISKDTWLYESLEAAEILLKQKNPGVNRRVVEAAQTNPTRLTWEAWMPKFDELFDKYGVKH